MKTFSLSLSCPLIFVFALVSCNKSDTAAVDQPGGLHSIDTNSSPQFLLLGRVSRMRLGDSVHTTAFRFTYDGNGRLVAAEDTIRNGNRVEWSYITDRTLSAKYFLHDTLVHTVPNDVIVSVTGDTITCNATSLSDLPGDTTSLTYIFKNHVLQYMKYYSDTHENGLQTDDRQYFYDSQNRYSYTHNVINGAQAVDSRRAHGWDEKQNFTTLIGNLNFVLTTPTDVEFSGAHNVTATDQFEYEYKYNSHGLPTSVKLKTETFDNTTWTYNRN